MIFVESVISGEVRNIDVDFRNYKRILRVACPKEVKQGETATILVAVMNFGTAPAKIKLSARGENLKLEQKSVEKTVQAKNGTFFEFRGKPVKKNEPFVFMVYPADKPEKITSVSGVSL